MNTTADYYANTIDRTFRGTWAILFFQNERVTYGRLFEGTYTEAEIDAQREIEAGTDTSFRIRSAI